MRFEKWGDKYLSVELTKTSILNLAFKDKDKELIIPVLNQISISIKNIWQTKRRDIELGLKYFEEQIEINKEKSEKSMLLWNLHLSMIWLIQAEVAVHLMIILWKY